MLELDPVLLLVPEEELDPVAAPVGLEVVGTIAGTELQAFRDSESACFLN